MYNRKRSLFHITNILILSSDISALSNRCIILSSAIYIYYIVNLALTSLLPIRKMNKEWVVNQSYNRWNNFPSLAANFHFFKFPFCRVLCKIPSTYSFDGNLFWLAQTRTTHLFLGWETKRSKLLHMFKPTVERHEAINVHLKTFIRHDSFVGSREAGNRLTLF